jgi:hypothetical protein
METLQFRDWLLEFDHERTVKAYELITIGSPEDCGCNECQAWVRHRGEVYPAEFLNLMSVLGITAKKEADVTGWEGGTVQPGTNRYTGEFLFVGKLLAGPDLYVPVPNTNGFNMVYSSLDARFDIGFSNRPAGMSVASTGFKGETQVAQLGFCTRVAFP